MPPLDRTLRRGLENAVKAARRVAEQAATKALESLAVGHLDPWPGQPTADRTLRVKLRARGRQLGDALDPFGVEREPVDGRGGEAEARGCGEVERVGREDRVGVNADPRGGGPCDASAEPQPRA